MPQNSLTFSLLKKLWDEFCSSRVFAIMIFVLDSIADGYNNSCFKRILIKLGDVSAYTKDSVFCK